MHPSPSGPAAAAESAFKTPEKARLASARPASPMPPPPAAPPVGPRVLSPPNGRGADALLAVRTEEAARFAAESNLLEQRLAALTQSQQCAIPVPLGPPCALVRRRRPTVARSAARYESDLYKAALSEMQAERRRLEQQIVDERAEIDVRLSAVACRRVLVFGVLGVP